MGERSIFDEDRVDMVAGDKDGILSHWDVEDAWLLFREQYGVRPDVLYVDPAFEPAVRNDEELWRMIVTEQKILMQPALNFEERIEYLDERTRDGSIGIMMGMDVVLMEDEDVGSGRAVMASDDEPIVEQSVLVKP